MRKMNPMKNNNLLNKPMILSLIISMVFFFSLLISSIVNNALCQFLLCLIVLFYFSLYIGRFHSRKFKEELSKINKIKISLYYFIFWFILTSSVVILMVLNTTLKDIPLFSFNQKEIIILSTIFLMNFIAFTINSLLIYYGLSFGCKISAQVEAVNVRKVKLKNYLLIIFFIVLGLYLYRLNTSAHGGATKAQNEASVSGIDSISTINYANTKLEYYYYIPQRIKKNKIQKAPFLIMIPGLSGNGQDFVTQPFKDFAQQNGFVIIAPSFIEDSKNWDSETSYQYPAAWSGVALNNILNDFITKQNINPKGLYLYGFSAGAQFTERYSLLYPKYVVACAFHSAGGITLPVSGQKTKFFVSVGSQDLDVRKEVAANFYNKAKKLGITVQYKKYSCGHELITEQINDTLAFFRQVINHS